MAELTSSPGKSGSSHHNRLPVRVDLTALVDLAFLLITFFMLTTTLAKPKMLELVMPDKHGEVVDAVPQSRTMTICLGKNNQAMWYLGMIDKPLVAATLTTYGESMDKAILSMVKQVQATTGHGLIVIVKPSAHSVYKNLVNTIDELNITQTSSYAVTDIAAKDIDLLKQKGIY